MLKSRSWVKLNFGHTPRVNTRTHGHRTGEGGVRWEGVVDWRVGCVTDVSHEGGKRVPGSVEKSGSYGEFGYIFHDTHSFSMTHTLREINFNTT